MNPVKGEESTTSPLSTAQLTPGSSIVGNKRLDSFIDSEIKIKTVDNEEIIGKLFTVDPITSCLALNILFGRFLVVVLNIANQTNLILILFTALKVRNHFILDWNTRCQSIPFNGQQLQKNAFRIIKISHIKELISVETKKANDERETTEISLDDIETAYAHASSAPQKIYIDQLNQREREAVKLAGQQAARIGVGVSKEAQAIFDALSKT